MTGTKPKNSGQKLGSAIRMVMPGKTVEYGGDLLNPRWRIRRAPWMFGGGMPPKALATAEQASRRFELRREGLLEVEVASLY